VFAGRSSPLDACLNRLGLRLWEASVVVIGYKTRAVPGHEHALPRRIGTHHLGPAGADTHATPVQACLVCWVQPKVAVVLLRDLVLSVEASSTRTRLQSDAHSPADERTRQRRDEQFGGIWIVLPMLCILEAERVACVLDDDMLEPAAGPNERPV
jgi:hypothetical protein